MGINFLILLHMSIISVNFQCRSLVNGIVVERQVSDKGDIFYGIRKCGITASRMMKNGKTLCKCKSSSDTFYERSGETYCSSLQNITTENGCKDVTKLSINEAGEIRSSCRVDTDEMSIFTSRNPRNKRQEIWMLANIHRNVISINKKKRFIRVTNKKSLNGFLMKIQYKCSNITICHIVKFQGRIDYNLMGPSTKSTTITDLTIIAIIVMFSVITTFSISLMIRRKYRKSKRSNVSLKKMIYFENELDYQPTERSQTIRIYESIYEKKNSGTNQTESATTSFYEISYEELSSFEHYKIPMPSNYTSLDEKYDVGTYTSLTTTTTFEQDKCASNTTGYEIPHLKSTEPKISNYEKC